MMTETSLLTLSPGLAEMNMYDGELRDLPGGSVSDASVLYERMLSILARRGFEKPGWFTPVEFATHLPVEENRKVVAFTEVYNSIRFGGQVSATAQLAGLLQEFEK